MHLFEIFDSKATNAQGFDTSKEEFCRSDSKAMAALYTLSTESNS